MGKTYFYLGINEDNKFVKFFQIIFGILCIAVALFWLVHNVKSHEADTTLWITIVFLSGFGFYQIWAGMGRTTRFIEVGQDFLRLKKNAILKSELISARDIEKIELFPLNVIFHLSSKKRLLFRLGTTYPETTESIKDAIINFSSTNNINLEFIEDQL